MLGGVAAAPGLAGNIMGHVPVSVTSSRVSIEISSDVGW